MLDKWFGINFFMQGMFHLLHRTDYNTISQGPYSHELEPIMILNHWLYRTLFQVFKEISSNTRYQGFHSISCKKTSKVFRPFPIDNHPLNFNLFEEYDSLYSHHPIHSKKEINWLTWVICYGEIKLVLKVVTFLNVIIHWTWIEHEYTWITDVVHPWIIDHTPSKV